MAAIKWTLQAADDLESITNFIAKDSFHFACLFAVDILNAIERLIKFPQSGRIVLEFKNPTIRELILGNYRIVYRYKKDIVEILTIYHSARILNQGKPK